VWQQNGNGRLRATLADALRGQIDFVEVTLTRTAM
jgi:hypothetical protein